MMFPDPTEDYMKLLETPGVIYSNDQFDLLNRVGTYSKRYHIAASLLELPVDPENPQPLSTDTLRRIMWVFDVQEQHCRDGIFELAVDSGKICPTTDPEPALETINDEVERGDRRIDFRVSFMKLPRNVDWATAEAPLLFKKEFIQLKIDQCAFALMNRWLAVPGFDITPAELVPVLKVVPEDKRHEVLSGVMALWKERSLGDPQTVDRLLRDNAYGSDWCDMLKILVERKILTENFSFGDLPGFAMDIAVMSELRERHRLLCQHSTAAVSEKQ